MQLKSVKFKFAQMAVSHFMFAKKSLLITCKMLREGFKLAQRRRDNRRTCQFRYHRNPREAAIKLRHSALLIRQRHPFLNGHLAQAGA